MSIKTFALSALTAALLASPLRAQTPATLPPFHAPPGTTDFAVKGEFFGAVRLTAETLYVQIDSGAVGAARPVEKVALAAALATNEGGQWHIIATSDSRPVSWTEGKWVRLPAGTAFAIALPPHFDPAEGWVLFQFTVQQKGQVGNTYTHASTMLNGAPRTVGPGV